MVAVICGSLEDGGKKYLDEIKVIGNRKGGEIGYQEMQALQWCWNDMAKRRRSLDIGFENRIKADTMPQMLREGDKVMVPVKEKFFLTDEEIIFITELLDALGKFNEDPELKPEYKKLINLETDLRDQSLRILKFVNQVMFREKIRTKQNKIFNKVILKLSKSDLL